MSVNLGIAGNPDVLEIDEAVSYYIDIEAGFKFSIVDLSINLNNFIQFLKDLKKKYKNIIEYDYSKTKNSLNKRFYCDDFKIYLYGNPSEMMLSIFAKSEDICQQIWNIYKKYNSNNCTSVQLYMNSFYLRGSSLEDNTKTIEIKDFEFLSESYYPYIDLNVMFSQFFTGDENILLCVGGVGLGKSKLSTMALKYAYNNTHLLPYDQKNSDDIYISVAYVKSIDVLITDAFWRTLESGDFDFVIIDDLDYMLTKRDAEVMSQDDIKKNIFLNQFLSFTDGVEKHKTKFIITTNQTYEDIDPALLRKGRLFDILELRKLTKDEAFVIWDENELSKKDFKQLFNDGDVLPADLGSEINKRLNKRILNSTVSYLKERNISKVEKANRKKKISL